LPSRARVLVARILDFQFTGSVPYTMEFTDGFVRFYSQQELVMAEEPRNVIYINEGTPATLVTSAPCSGRTVGGRQHGHVQLPAP
jgi:hypothetical protein